MSDILLWALGHVGLKGTEAADKMAKQALKNNMIDVNLPIFKSGESLGIEVINQYNGGGELKYEGFLFFGFKDSVKYPIQKMAT